MNDNAKKWVAALRSGKYQQTTGQLRDLDDTYCCLGVACEVAMQTEGFYNLNRTGNSQYFEETTGHIFGSYLPSSVQKWLGLSDGDGGFQCIGDETDSDNSLTALNDELNWDFDRIADFIESEPKGLFVEEEK